MTATGRLEARTAELVEARVPHVLATVVRAERPTSAKPGDRAVVTPDGTIDGFVGGVCADTTVRAQALAVLESGEPRLVRITPDAPEEDAGGEADAAASWTAGTVTVANPCLSGGTLEVFLEPRVPPPLVMVVGEGPIALALRQAGGSVGFEVRAWPAGEPLPPDTAGVVVASHGRGEEEALTAALEAGTPYVGLVASRRRGSAVVASLPLCEGHRSQVRTPAGLDIGAQTPEHVALSILAEIVSTRPRPPSRPTAEHEAPAAAAGTATDPVCGMSVAMVPASLSAEHDGDRYWFCGPGCRDAFVASPHQYLPS